MTAPILLVDDDIDLCASIAEVFISCLNVSTICATGLAEVKALEKTVLTCRVAILDINLGQNLQSGLDVYDWLVFQKFPGKIIFLTGHAENHPLVIKAKNVGPVSIYTKPLSIEQILNIGRVS